MNLLVAIDIVLSIKKGTIFIWNQALENQKYLPPMERKTRQHQAIFDVIVDAHRPLLAQEVLTLASMDVPRLSLATVYRNIKALQDDGDIRAVILPGQNPRYEVASRAHHHHFQCRQCEKVFDLEACPGNLDRLAPSGFKVEDHEIILYGSCCDCSVGLTNSPAQ